MFRIRSGFFPLSQMPRQSRAVRLRTGILAVLATSFLLIFCMGSSPAQDVTLSGAALVSVDGPIGPSTSAYIVRSLEQALTDRRALVVLTIDTPGGLDSSTREIVQAILASPVPVVAYVSPSGARAASAGTYILYASHVAAMAPATNVGAATPIQIGGGSVFPSPEKDEDGEADAPPAAAEKAISDSIAYLRSLAELRGRNPDWAEASVREAASVSATEALETGVIDIIAADTSDLMRQLDGRTVETVHGRSVLNTAAIPLIAYEPDWRTRILAVITNPNVAYILLLIGVYGLLLEFYSPGTFIAGITGAICLFLGLYALNLLPVNYAGFALVGLGVVLMVAEAFAPSFGALGIGGAAAFVAGSLMLMETDAPGFQISRVFIGSIATLTSGLFLFVMWMLLRARRRRVATGMEEMIASHGEVIDWSGTSGHVRIHGEVWLASAALPLRPGQQVEVHAMDGLRLKVIPIGKDTQ